MILKHAYESTTKPAPRIPKDSMRKLLMICTSRTPFRNLKSEIYLQREGVSMGNPLGPTFANFYMCELENSVLLDNQNLKIPLYVRYVDDICLIVNRFGDVEILKRSFERNSVIKFTLETEIKKMPFLGIIIIRNQNSLSTSIFTIRNIHYTNTAKPRAIHSNIQTAQSNPSLVGSEPTMH